MAVPETRIYQQVTAVADDTFDGMRVAWSGVWSGFIVGTGVFLLLSTLGLAVGVTAANIGVDENLDPGRLGTGAAIWGGLTLLISLYIGGMVATRTGMVYDRASGFIEGVLVWVLSILAIVYMAGSGIGMVASSASGILGGITQGVQTAVSEIDVAELASGDVDQIAARLTAPATVQLVSAATGLSDAEARAELSDIRQRVEAVRDNPAEAVAAARQGLQELASTAAVRIDRAAAAAQPYVSRTMWITLLAMILALAAAVGGAMTGRRQASNRMNKNRA